MFEIDFISNGIIFEICMRALPEYAKAQQEKNKEESDNIEKRTSKTNGYLRPPYLQEVKK